MTHPDRVADIGQKMQGAQMGTSGLPERGRET